MGTNSLRCLCSMYKFEEIRCTSRRAETRAAFARKWSQALGMAVVPMDTIEAVVRGADIVVGGTTNYWRKSKLFIFDDTLLHQSFNESDKARYCLFVDIARPSMLPAMVAWVVTLNRFLFRGLNSIFYKKWKVIEAQ